MSNNTVIAQVGLAERPRKSRLPARLDLLQSLSGLFLALFMWGHMFFVATILVSEDLMWTVTKFFEGYYFFGQSYPWLVSVIVGIVALVFIIHAALAVRKFPINFRQLQVMRAHAKEMRHHDTSLWLVQVYTGFAMFFLASAHLYQMFVWPELIGPGFSGDRMWGAYLGFWFYPVLLLCVELHGSIGLYRLAVKWCIPNMSREFLSKLEKALLVFFLLLGAVTLIAYMKIGIHVKAGDFQKDYTPSSVMMEHSKAAPTSMDGMLVKGE
ncbi:MAG: fumarate reductase cytochrome b subunit [Burkholderiales bacterium]|jgi:fumarate reductase subunit C|nr:fumarate reductase cytochrome b subunit [Burkholderiales bacterium]